MSSSESNNTLNKNLQTGLTLYKVFLVNDIPICVHVDGSVSVILQFKGIDPQKIKIQDFESVLFQNIQNKVADINNGSLSVQFSLLKDSVEMEQSSDDIEYTFFKQKMYISLFLTHTRRAEIENIKEYINRIFGKNPVKTSEYDRIEKGIDQRIRSLFSIAKDFSDTLQNVGLNFSVLGTKKDYYSVWQNFVNPNGSKEKADDLDSEEFSKEDLISGAEGEVNQSDFILNKYIHKVWILDRLPSDYVYGKIVGISCKTPIEFLYTVGFQKKKNLKISSHFIMRIKKEELDKLCSQHKTIQEEELKQIEIDIIRNIFRRYGFSTWASEYDPFYQFIKIIPGFCNLNSEIIKFLTISDQGKSVLVGTDFHKKNETNIYEDLMLYKVVNTKKGKPVVVHLDGSASVIVSFEGINNTSFSEEYFEKVVLRRIQTTIEDIIDPTLSIQFTMVRENTVPDIDQNIDKLYKTLKPRGEYLKNLAENYRLFVNKFYLAIHCSSNKSLKNKQALVQLAKKALGNNNQNESEFNELLIGLEDRMNRVLETSDLLCQMLSDVGSSFKILTSKKEYYDIWQNFTRPNKSKEECVKINDSIESPRQALFSGIRATVFNNDFILDDYYHKVWTLERAPKETIFGKSIDLIESIPMEFIYSITFRKLSHHEANDLFRFKLAEKRILAGNNKDAIVEDRSLTAEEQRISDNYDAFSYGNASGAYASVQLVIRIKNSVLNKKAKEDHLSRQEEINRIDQSIAKKVFGKFGYSEWINEEATGWPVFCRTIPGFGAIGSGTLKHIFLSTQDIPYFLALYDNKRNLHHNGTNHFIDQRSNMVVFDLMDPSLPAWNYCISGQTGSGKSVLMNTILYMQFADMAAVGEKPVVCILDVGGDRGSYQKFMKLFNGTEINLSGIVKPSIQMFEIIPERSNPTPAKIKAIATELSKHQNKYEGEKLEIRVRAFFSKVLEEGANNLNQHKRIQFFEEIFECKHKKEFDPLFVLEPGTCEPSSRSFNMIMGILDVILSTNIKVIDGFKNFDYDEVSQIVLETYRRTPGRFPFMRDFINVANELMSPEDVEQRAIAKKFIMKLTNWTRTGAYPMFDDETSIDLSNDVILADLKGLESNPQLQVVYTLLISQLYNDKMYFTKGRRKLIIRDEAWSIMQNERARKYFVEDLRTARKNGFATIALSQLPTDYLNPDPNDGRAILSQMIVKIFCKFDTEQTCKDVATEFGLSEEVAQEMTTLGLERQIQPDGSYKTLYSKFMMIIDKQIYSLFNILHPFEYILYSSSVEDNEVVDYYLNSGKFNNLEEILWMISRNEHLGDLDLAVYLEKRGYNNMARRVRGGTKK